MTTACPTLEIALQLLYRHSTPLAPNSVAILRRRARRTANPHINP